MKYTHKDLKDVKRRYTQNFNTIMRNLDTPRYKKYIERESVLYFEEVRIMKALGLLISDPCSLNSNIPCERCTGCIRKIRKKGSDGKVIETKWIETKKSDLGAEECYYRQFDMKTRHYWAKPKGMIAVDKDAFI